MRSGTLRHRGATAFISLAVVAAICVLTGTPSGAGPPSIVLYNGQHPQLTDEIVAAFSRQTGIAVSVRTNDGIVLADQILQEGGSSPADVYLTENSPGARVLGAARPAGQGRSGHARSGSGSRQLADRATGSAWRYG